jgi:3-hydroxyacyl-CoA dehydrogenase/enoyl-CoA hydratase/3-hydroxybutyryl-CoA epimerase
VVLKDINSAAAEKGKAHSAALLDKKVARGQMSAEQREAVLARIQTTEDDADLAGCDLIIEAVFEDRELKAKVSWRRKGRRPGRGDRFQHVDPADQRPGHGGAGPEQVHRPAFLQPVDKMPLVEIIKGPDQR